MGNVMAYSGLTTKIRAMQAKLLTQADYETISGFTVCCAGGGISEDRNRPTQSIWISWNWRIFIEVILRRCCISLCIMITQESSGLRESTRRNF